MKPLRQGDVILIPVKTEITGTSLTHLTLAEGELTGHRHRIESGEAELFQVGSVLYLQVRSETALLVHEEHQALKIPQGDWSVKIQREYEPQGWHPIQD